MEKLPFTRQTSNVALVAAAMYVVYGFLSVPYIQFLVSLATFGIVYGGWPYGKAIYGCF